MLNTKSNASNRVGRNVAWSLLAIASLLPMLTGTNCSLNDAQRDQVRTDMAPAVATVFGSLGDMVGAGVGAWIKPVPDEATTETSLK